MYWWYKISASQVEATIDDTANYKIRRFYLGMKNGYSLPGEKPSAKTLLVRTFFSLITNGKLCIYCAENENEIIHTAYVIPACWKFPFMKRGEYEIGPCETLPEYRGRGIYPTVLKKIVSDYKNTTFHMLVAENNSSSIRGVEKAGFIRVGHSIVTPLKRYIGYEDKKYE